MFVSATIDVYIHQGYVLHATTQFYLQQPRTCIYVTHVLPATKDAYIRFEYGYFPLSVVVHVDSFSRWYVVFQFYIRKNLFLNKIGSCEIVFHKMAAPESSRKRSHNTDEAVFAILVDDDSDNETFEEETVDEDSSSSENDENQVPAPIAAPVRGAPVRKFRQEVLEFQFHKMK